MDDKRIIEDIAEKLSVKPSDVRYMLDFYRDYIRAHLKDFDPHKPLIDQYTGFLLPGIGQVSIVKSYLTMDAFELSLVPDTKEFDPVRKIYTPEKLKAIRKRYEENIAYVDDIKRDGYVATMERFQKEDRDESKKKK